MLEPSEKTMYKDRYHLTYLLFYALGTATLVPSLFFTTATSYWMYKFREPTINESLTDSSKNRTELQAEFASDFSIVASVANVVFLICTTMFLRKFAVVRRIITVLVAAVAIFAVTIIFVEIDTDSWQRGFFITTLILGFILTGCCSILLVTLIQLMASFPPKYFAAVLAGESICGIFAALVQIFSLAVNASPVTSGLTYFLIGLFFIFSSLIGFLTSWKKSAFFNYYLHKKVTTTQKTKFTKEMFFSVINKVRFYLISMIIISGSSVMVHPGVTSLVVSIDNGNGNKWNDVFFVPATTFLIYYFFDYIGREFARWLNKPNNGLVLLFLGLLRIAFVPLIMLCNAHPRKHLSVVFDEDFVYIIFIVIFSFTNGFLVNLCAMQVSKITEGDERTLSLILVLVIMVVSMGSCSFLSAALVKSL